MRMRISILAPSGLALIAILFSAGCTPSASQQQAAADARAAEARYVLGPLVDEDGGRRSLALDSSAMRDLHAFQPWLEQQASWYDTRLDSRRGVSAGSRRVILSISETTVRDKVDSNNGRVRDEFEKDSTRRRVIEIIR